MQWHDLSVIDRIRDAVPQTQRPHPQNSSPPKARPRTGVIIGVMLCTLLVGGLSGTLSGTLRAQSTSAAPAPAMPGESDEHYEVDPVTGFRMERYRAPVPQSVPGGTTINTAILRELMQGNTGVLIDVYPPVGLGADPLDGHWVVSEPHDTLPGAIWLPEVGRGFLTDEHVDYFRRNLARLRSTESGIAQDAPFVFFCFADCWQSWNAAKRTAMWGFGPVMWYPEGTDGWLEAGGKLVPARPLNFMTDEAEDVPVNLRP